MNCGTAARHASLPPQVLAGKALRAPRRGAYFTVSCAVTECDRDPEAAVTVKEKLSEESLAPQPIIPNARTPRFAQKERQKDGIIYAWRRILTLPARNDPVSDAKTSNTRVEFIASLNALPMAALSSQMRSRNGRIRAPHPVRGTR